MNPNVASATLLSVTQSVVVFSALLPELSDVRKSVADPDMLADVRLGEGASVALVVATGIVASTLTESPIPAMVSVLAAGALVLMYESVLATQPKGTKA